MRSFIIQHEDIERIVNGIRTVVSWHISMTEMSVERDGKVAEGEQCRRFISDDIEYIVHQ